jgi:SpoVK/Ycf46/Vps4 family AAA+-type ATPase
MTAARHILALLRSHIDGDDAQFLSVAMQVAAQEARQGHGKLAQELRDLVDKARSEKPSARGRVPAPVPLAQPKGELSGLVEVRYSDIRLSSMILPSNTEGRLRRVLTEQRQRERLRAAGLSPRRKLLLIGPPGAGKTMTAAAIAGEMHQPLFTALLDGLITKFMGETASKLRLVFEAMAETRGVYFFDEFDAIGARRSERNDVGEIRRVLNSFLQFLENDDSDSIIIAATNHPELLDPALYRRFDDVIEYALPDPVIARRILETRLSTFSTKGIDWPSAVAAGEGLSQAELARAAADAAKHAVLDDRDRVTAEDLSIAIAERKAASRR